MQKIQWINFVDNFLSSITRVVNCHSFFSYETETESRNLIGAIHFNNVSTKSVQNYLNHMCEHDPIFFKNFSCDLKKERFGIAHLNQENIPCEYQPFLLENQVADNIELYFECGEEKLIGISLIRSNNEGIFSAQDILIIECCYQLARFNNSYIGNNINKVPAYYKILTYKEQKVLELILQGKKNQDIANEMFVSLATIKTHVQHIFQKMMVSNRQELILKTISS